MTDNKLSTKVLDIISDIEARPTPERRPYDRTALSDAEIERLQNADPTETQVANLESFGFEWDTTPIREGGSFSRWHAAEALDTLFAEAKARREAEPISDRQREILMHDHGVPAAKTVGLTFLEAKAAIQYLDKRKPVAKAIASTPKTDPAPKSPTGDNDALISNLKAKENAAKRIADAQAELLAAMAAAEKLITK